MFYDPELYDHDVVTVHYSNRNLIQPYKLQSLSYSSFSFEVFSNSLYEEKEATKHFMRLRYTPRSNHIHIYWPILV